MIVNNMATLVFYHFFNEFTRDIMKQIIDTNFINQVAKARNWGI